LGIAACIKTDHNEWDTHQKEVDFAINTSVQSTAENMPFEVVFGHKQRVPLDNIFFPREWIGRSHVDDLRREVYIRII
jgi:hypothetical protein